MRAFRPQRFDRRSSRERDGNRNWPTISSSTSSLFLSNKNSVSDNKMWAAGVCVITERGGLMTLGFWLSFSAPIDSLIIITIIIIIIAIIVIDRWCEWTLPYRTQTTDKRRKGKNDWIRKWVCNEWIDIVLYYKRRRRVYPSWYMNSAVSCWHSRAGNISSTVDTTVHISLHVEAMRLLYL